MKFYSIEFMMRLALRSIALIIGILIEMNTTFAKEEKQTKEKASIIDSLKSMATQTPSSQTSHPTSQ